MDVVIAMNSAKQGCRVLFVTTSAHTYEAAGGRTRIIEEARFLRSHDYDVRLLCLAPLRNWTRLRGLRESSRRLRKDFGGEVFVAPQLPLRRLPLWVQLGWNALIVLVAAVLTRSRIIHGHGPGAAAAAILARRFCRRLKVISDFHGAAAEERKQKMKSAADVGDVQRIHAVERMCATSDAIVVVSRRLAQYLAATVDIRLGNAVVVPCATNVPHLEFGHRAEIRNRYGLEGRFVFVYSGSYRPYQRIDRMLELFVQLLRRRRRRFPDVADKSPSRVPEELLRQPIPESSYFLTSARRDLIPEIMLAADCGFLIRDRSALNQVASPTKFAEYLAAGVPVLAEGDIGDYSDLIRENDVGHLIQEHEGIESILRFMSRVEADRAAYWYQCRAICNERLSWRVAGRPLVRLYQDISGQLRAAPSG